MFGRIWKISCTQQAVTSIKLGAREMHVACDGKEIVVQYSRLSRARTTMVYKTYEPSTRATFQPPASLSLSSSPNSLIIRCFKLSIS